MDFSTSTITSSTSVEATEKEEIVDIEEDSGGSWEEGDKNGEYIPKGKKDKSVRLFNQDSLSNCIRNMGIPKDASEYMSAELKSCGIVEQVTKSTFYKNREKTFCQYFNKDEEGSLVYCPDIGALINAMKEKC